MRICNNSDLAFQVVLSYGTTKCSITLNPRERTTSEEMFATKSADTPRYFQISVIHNKKKIEQRNFIDNNTYVGLLCSRGKPHIYVGFEDDDSEEAKTPTDEMVRLIADAFQKYVLNPSHHLSTDWTNVSSTEHKFSSFLCYSREFFKRRLMRPEQAWNAFKFIIADDSPAKLPIWD